MSRTKKKEKFEYHTYSPTKNFWSRIKKRTRRLGAKLERNSNSESNAESRSYYKKAKGIRHWSW